MGRSKSTPQQNALASEKPLQLRVRHAGGTAILPNLLPKSTLSDLLEKIKVPLKAEVSSLSFRGDDMRPVTLVADGQLPAGGLLLITMESRLDDLGIGNGVQFNVSAAPSSASSSSSSSTSSKPFSNSGSSTGKASTGKRKRGGGGGLGGDGGGGVELGDLETTVLHGGARAGDSADNMAMSFLHSVGSDGGGLLGSGVATSMAVTQDGAQRVEAALKGLVTISDVGKSGKSIDVEFRSSASRKARSERLRTIDSDTLNEVVMHILLRQAGSKRRQLAVAKANGGRGPTSSLLTPEIIATRSPALFWALYDMSRSSRDETGDVQFALDHVVKAACELYEVHVAGGGAGGGSATAASSSSSGAAAEEDEEDSDDGEYEYEEGGGDDDE